MKYIDAEKLKNIVEQTKQRALKGAEVDEDFYCNGRSDAFEEVLLEIDSLQREQPEVDLEKAIEKGWEELEKDYSPSALDKSYIIVSGLVGEKQFSRIARHFYELGELNARKEETKMKVDNKLRTCDKLEMEKLYGEEY